LGTSAEVPTHAELQEAASPAILEIEGNPQHPWEQLVLKHGGGDPIALIERNPVVEGELGFDEIEEFIEEVGDYQPTSAADWLKRYLPTVKVIYSFQLLSGTEENDGFTRLHQVYGTVWRKAGGILQADQEGFSNEDGCTILWQFSDHVDGPWNAGVISPDGKWNNFEMDLGDTAQRQAFFRGEVPPEAKPFLSGRNPS
jgi:hypothetical protein